jgi:hypothetical protein
MAESIPTSRLAVTSGGRRSSGSTPARLAWVQLLGAQRAGRCVVRICASASPAIYRLRRCRGPKVSRRSGTTNRPTSEWCHPECTQQKLSAGARQPRLQRREGQRNHRLGLVSPSAHGKCGNLGRESERISRRQEVSARRGGTQQVLLDAPAPKAPHRAPECFALPLHRV